MLLSIEGNIGAGKSTILKRVAITFSNTYIYPERISEWTCVHGREQDYNIISW